MRKRNKPTLTVFTPTGNYMRPAWGCLGVPAHARAVWGARGIRDYLPPQCREVSEPRYDVCLIRNRQALVGSDRDTLRELLRSGTLNKALQAAAWACDAGDAGTTYELYRDGPLVVIGSEQRSHGYFYLSAWLEASTSTTATPSAVGGVSRQTERHR